MARNRTCTSKKYERTTRADTEHLSIEEEDTVQKEETIDNKIYMEIEHMQMLQHQERLGIGIGIHL